ncbi:type IV toxin-antitoxin system AbiEi family antitoxin domain-containing protein [Geobacter grbiciae]|uniref:type IV toxin-antitoxin system AbiEi family antitoxin domain-containing protein n=1 Tax=Geobacter grbiciae TaxID=155042 RepID=UPI001C02F6E4|nr:type IV toxin-antitoxin system AbiEi family antitoxin domain-containing protein [Geobacter grbiciae]MBT1076088.1 type IV toxin-antitoxin system AbiEi family antitoxin domain-containing protein [Geobacter grbiciae]
MKNSRTDKIIEIARRAGVIRPRDLDAYGIPREYLRRLCDKVVLERRSRGIYALADADLTEHHSVALASKRVPKGVVCLLSALRFHRLTTQAPFEIWMAIDRKARLPKAEGVPLHIVRFSAAALTEGVEHHQVEGMDVPVYCLAKTVVDCFKYRNKIGLDVALEALRGCLRERRCTIDELWRYAKICRVANVIRPYLESLS